MSQQKAPNCFHCRHYYVTWERSFPHGCRSLGFKTKMMPSREVFLASGIHCHYFAPKDPGGGQKQGQQSQPNRPNSSFTREA